MSILDPSAYKLPPYIYDDYSGNRAFSPWSASYPTPLHAVWAGDPAWSNPGDGNAVSSWRNQSGGGDPAQATGTAQPTYRASTAAFNDRPTVQFDGGDWLRSAFSGGLESQRLKVLLVVSRNPADTSTAFCDGDDATNRLQVARNGGTGTLDMAAGTNLTGTDASDPMVVLADFNGASSVLEVNGTQTASGDAGSSGADGVVLGHNYTVTGVGGLTGHIAYWGLYPGAADLSGLVAALGDHYSITIAA